MVYSNMGERERESVPSELPCNGAEGESGMGTVSLIQLNGGRKCLDARSTEKQS